MAVHAELWSQSCLRIDDLKANVACIGFGVPLFSLTIVKQIAEDCPDIIDNTHLFYIQNDVFPCVLQCVDFPKPKEKSKKSSRKNEVTDLVALFFISDINELQLFCTCSCMLVQLVVI